MPQIPFQDSPTVAPSGPPGVFQNSPASPSLLGGSQASALQNVGSSLLKLGDVQAENAIRLQRIKNETDVDNANTQYDSMRRDVLFGDNGFYTKHGKDAYDAMTPTAQTMEDMRQEVKSSLQSPEAQRMFDIYSRRSTEIDMRSMSMHAATEYKSYQVGTAEASIKNSQAEAYSYYNDPYRFSLALGNIKMQAENRARLLGRTDPEQIQADVSHYVGQTWVARIEGTMQHDPILADQMYRANADQIGDVAAKVQLEHNLKSAVLPVEAKNLADSIISGRPNAEPNTTPAGGTGDVAPTTPQQAATSPVNPVDTRASLGQWVVTAAEEAEKLHPNDPVFRDMVLTQVKGYVNTIVAAQEGTARQVHSALTAIASGASGGPKPVTLDELFRVPQARQAWSMMDGSSQRGILAILDHNAREASGELSRGNQGLFNELQRRIYLGDGDPNRIASPTQITQFYANGNWGAGLNFTQGERLRKELAEASTPEGNPFLKKVNEVKTSARKMLTGSLSSVALGHPELAEEAAYRFGMDLDAKIKAARAKGIDPQELFVPGSKDYVLDPARVSAFLPTEAQVKARVAAGKIPQGATTATNPKTGEKAILVNGQWQILKQ